MRNAFFLSLTLLCYSGLSSSSAIAQLPEPVPFPQIQPPTVPPPTIVQRPLTIYEFARAFKPLPGKYDVLLCHPYTGKPVRACFTLPPGCIQVHVRKKLFCYEIDFDYGRFEIELNFGKRGRFRVDYND